MRTLLMTCRLRLAGMVMICAGSMFGAGCIEQKPAAMTQTVRQDFRQEFDPQRFQLHGGASPAAFCSMEDDGLHVRVTPQDANVGSRGISARFQVSGDFEIVAGFKIVNVPKPDKGFGAGMAISIRDENDEWATLQRVHHPERGHVIIAHRAIPEATANEPGKFRHSVESMTCQAKEGQLCMKRTGSDLEYSFTVAPETTPQVIRMTAYSRRPLKQIHFDAQTGQGGKQVDVVWTNITVTCDEMMSRKATAGQRPVDLPLANFCTHLTDLISPAVFLLD